MSSSLTAVFLSVCSLMLVVAVFFVASRLDKRVLKRELAKIEQLSSGDAKRSVSKLLRYFTLTNKTLRNAAFSGLVELGKPSVPYLIEKLEHLDLWPALNGGLQVRRMICRALGELRDASAVPALRKQSLQGGILESAESVEALRLIGNNEAKLALLEASQRAKGPIKRLASLAVLDPADEANRQALIDGVYDGIPLVSFQAIRMATGIADPDIIAAIQAKTNDGWDEIRDAALNALRAVGETPMPSDVHPLMMGARQKNQ